jgi:hypothetical protein
MSAVAAKARVLTAHVSSHDIGIPIMWNGTFWDVLQWFESAPKHVPRGYVCDLCPEDDQRRLTQHDWKPARLATGPESSSQSSIDGLNKHLARTEWWRVGADNLALSDNESIRLHFTDRFE